MHNSEKFNVYSHFIGAIFSTIGLIPLAYYSINSHDKYKIISIAIYGFCLVFLFACSTIYHRSSGKKREYLQKLDHISIFLLISGTYTPYLLIVLRETSGIYLLIAIWTISFFGILFKFFLAHRFDFLSTLMYVFCGWLILFDFKNFQNLFTGNGFYLLCAGGIAYTVGAVFYLMEKLPKNHEVWHLFVMLGALLHYISILFYLI